MISDDVATASDPALGLADGTPTPQGTLVVKQIKKFTSLAKAGVKPGDEIVSLGSIKGAELLTRSPDVEKLLAEVGVGRTIALKLRRGAKVVELAVKLVAKKDLSVSVENIDLALERKIAP